ncbi:hypothetical protein KDA14_02840 [Candidatus Saccharibacteria bacterium]|nr:hypothetical protein [Candidatus Saccharibacteria bacterium]
MREYWVKQDSGPLFSDLLWARPEMKSAAGKLLIVGGHAQSFAVPAAAYAAAEQSGVGVARVLLPASLEKTVSKLFPAAAFAPGNPSGGFAKTALAELLAESQWADGVLLAGDLGRNSETHAMLENFASKYSGQLTITKDAADFFCTQPTNLRERPKTLLVVSSGQLQKLASNLHWHHAFTSDLGLVQFVELLHEFTIEYSNLHILTRHLDQNIVAIAGRVSTTPAPADKPIWRVERAAAAATWWLQNPNKPFEALTTSLLGKDSV